MPFYVATCLVLIAFTIAWWGLPKVMGKQQPQQRLQPQQPQQQQYHEEEKYDPPTYQQQHQQHQQHHQRNGVDDMSSHNMSSPTLSPENLRRLSIVQDDGETLNAASPEQLRMARIEWMLNK